MNRTARKPVSRFQQWLRRPIAMGWFLLCLLTVPGVGDLGWLWYYRYSPAQPVIAGDYDESMKSFDGRVTALEDWIGSSPFRTELVLDVTSKQSRLEKRIEKLEKWRAELEAKHGAAKRR